MNTIYTKQMQFKNVKPGSDFVFDNRTYIKMKPPYYAILNRKYNAVRFGTGDLVGFLDDDRVLVSHFVGTQEDDGPRGDKEIHEK